MTDRITLTEQDFFNAGPATGDFVDLSRQCLARRATLELAIGGTDISVQLAPDRPDTGPATGGNAAVRPVRLGGGWRLADLAGGLAESASGGVSGGATGGATGVRLLLPLLFRIARVSLPHDQVHALARTHRSPAAFFVRNLALALLRGGPLALEQVAEAPDASRNLRLFQSQYVFVLKSLVPDPALTTRPVADVQDMLPAECFLPVLGLDNPVLVAGMAAIRRQDPWIMAGRRRRLMQARAFMLAQFPS